jgi:hypothetical protein
MASLLVSEERLLFGLVMCFGDLRCNELMIARRNHLAQRLAERACQSK